MSTAPRIRLNDSPLTAIFAVQTWCPRQDLNLRSRLRRPAAFIYSDVIGVLPGLLPGHLCLQWPQCRVVESTIDSTSH